MNHLGIWKADGPSPGTVNVDIREDDNGFSAWRVAAFRADPTRTTTATPLGRVLQNGGGNLTMESLGRNYVGYGPDR